MSLEESVHCFRGFRNVARVDNSCVFVILNSVSFALCAVGVLSCAVATAQLLPRLRQLCVPKDFLPQTCGILTTECRANNDTELLLQPFPHCCTLAGSSEHEVDRFSASPLAPLLTNTCVRTATICNVAQAPLTDLEP